MIKPRPPSGSRWTREANVQRYRKLLNTPLTEIERAFVERRPLKSCTVDRFPGLGPKTTSG